MIKKIIDAQRNYGYRREWAVLKYQQAVCVKHKRIYRIMRDA